MNKNILFLLLTSVISNPLFSQNIVEWTPKHLITLESFQASVPDLVEDNIQQYNFSANYEFSYQMMNVQFAFTKNFNNYAFTYYNPELSWIEEGEFTEQLLLMANLDFDLIELYVRKFRKQMYEQKKVASNPNFFVTIHDKIAAELNTERVTIINKFQSLEDPTEFLLEKSKEVNSEIDALHEFCKACRPKKKKKKK